MSMDEPSEKPAGIHYVLIVFVMLSMILGASAYMNWREMSDLKDLMAARESEVAKSRKSLTNQDDQIQALLKSAAASAEEKKQLEERITELEKAIKRQTPEADSK